MFCLTSANPGTQWVPQSIQACPGQQPRRRAPCRERIAGLVVRPQPQRQAVATVLRAASRGAFTGPGLTECTFLVHSLNVTNVQQRNRTASRASANTCRCCTGAVEPVDEPSARREEPKRSPGTPPFTDALRTRSFLGLSSLTLARLALVGTTLVWAANNVLVKKLYRLGLQPGMVTAVRFSLSALVLSPFATWQALRPALGLSMTSFAGNASLALSLRFTSTGRASFFAAMSVAVTPLLELLLYGSPLRPGFLTASSLCVIGVFLMSRESLLQVRLGQQTGLASETGAGLASCGALRGDMLALLAAFWFALYNVRLSREAPKHRTEALSSSLRVWTACFSTIWACFEIVLGKHAAPTGAHSSAKVTVDGGSGALLATLSIIREAVRSLFTRLHQGGITAYLGLAALAVLVIVGAYFQVYGQQRISSQEAAVLYTLNPIWAGLAGYLFLAETFTLEQGLGGLCILFGCLAARRQQQQRSPVTSIPRK
jgi:drug/metabolite transporter (DMT)-like permease